MGVDAGVTGGSLAVAAVGAMMLPIEPFSGVTLLATGLGGLGFGAAARKQRDLKAQQAAESSQHEQQVQALESQLKDAEAARHADRAAADARAEVLALQNQRLKYWLLGGIAITGAVALYRYTQYRKRKSKTATLQLGPNNVHVEHNVPASYAPKPAGDEDSCCVICVEHVPDALLRPCMHLQLCWACLQRLPTAACPACRATFTEVDYVYLA